MNKVVTILILLFSIVGNCFILEARQLNKSEKPNILFIFIDDLGKEWISSYGAEEIKTPSIDMLANTGILFDSFYSMPQCTPSRVTLMTGQYPFRHGWVNHWDVPRWGSGIHFDWNKNPGLAYMMKKAGYKTAVAGKWQINDFRIQPDAMTHHGFDDYCMWTGGEAGNPASDERYWNPYIHTKLGSKTYKGEFGEDIFSDFLIRFMKENKKHPMFLYYPMCLTHTPFTSTPLEPDVTGKYDCHKAMVRYMDFIIGKMIGALDELDLRDNTIVMITTDNGTTPEITGVLKGKQVRGGKQSITENGICEPFIVNCPGLIQKGIVSHALADLSDIMPTLAQLAGAELPQGFLYDGVSFADVITGKNMMGERKWIMAMGGDGGGSKAMVSEKGVESNYIFRERVVRNRRYKLYISSTREPFKLVDLVNDPEEKSNLLESKDPLIIDAKNELIKALESFSAKDCDPIYDPLPPQEWDKKITVNSQVWKK